jgi:hypothetical protein
VHAAYGASAPLLFFKGGVSPYAYSEFATGVFAAANASCPNNIRQGFLALNATKTNDTLWADVQKVFHLCTPPLSIADIDALIDRLYNGLSTMPMVNYPYPSNLVG